MRRVIVASMFVILSACASKPGSVSFLWPNDLDAIPNEHTAIMISLAIWQGQFNTNLGDPAELATHMEAFRYRRRDLVHDPEGDAWFVRQKREEAAAFMERCAGHCLGGQFYTMALDAHDGRVLEFRFIE